MLPYQVVSRTEAAADGRRGGGLARPDAAFFGGVIFPLFCVVRGSLGGIAFQIMKRLSRRYAATPLISFSLLITMLCISAPAENA